MQDRQELIDIQAVADSFGKSVESIRKYKNFGIIRVSDKRGNKDLFDREEIMSIRDRLRELRLKGLSLAQIADELDIARDEHLSLPSPPTSMSGQTPHHEPGRPLKILVVDDEDEVRAGLREFLEGMDYAICEAADGAEALAKTFTEKPHMILLDLRLPKVDGYQVCQTLKGNPITSGIPIIMLTALNATPNKIKGIEFGADDYVDKPFDLDELAARIKMVTRRMGVEA
ncbi:MAG: response regulator [Gemmatimonadetes bacterium]|jgi:CheY-like chemotaxis protein|nr:response regulator [Gemmatimonadota bacterium]MBT5325784.1 response regulator [Gemmatimonadota bacterium]MBT5449027.1 response regulator [Gemmatimonadota bacterium]MBT5804303.1 response regulator [Gemmatimonadota bacterium]MBT6619267.1 response regulator [Gemmatimonadota bacterium]